MIIVEGQKCITLNGSTDVYIRKADNAGERARNCKLIFGYTKPEKVIKAALLLCTQ